MHSLSVVPWPASVVQGNYSSAIPERALTTCVSDRTRIHELFQRPMREYFQGFVIMAGSLCVKFSDFKFWMLNGITVRRNGKGHSHTYVRIMPKNRWHALSEHGFSDAFTSAVTAAEFVLNCRTGTPNIQKLLWTYGYDGMYGDIQGNLWETYNQLAVDVYVEEHFGRIRNMYPGQLTAGESVVGLNTSHVP